MENRGTLWNAGSMCPIHQLMILLIMISFQAFCAARISNISENNANEFVKSAHHSYKLKNYVYDHVHLSGSALLWKRCALGIDRTTMERVKFAKLIPNLCKLAKICVCFSSSHLLWSICTEELPVYCRLHYSHQTAKCLVNNLIISV